MDKLSVEIPMSKMYEPTQLALYLTGDSQGDHNGLSWQKLFEVGIVTDYWLENTHDYIQWWFPLDEPSRSKPFLPYLSDQDIYWMKERAEIHNNQMLLLNRFKQFLMGNDFWICHYNHNHLRITRIIKSLRLLIGDTAADEFKCWLFNHLESRSGAISDKAKKFWDDA